jgi:hypothetical protein
MRLSPPRVELYCVMVWHPHMPLVGSDTRVECCRRHSIGPLTILSPARCDALMEGGASSAYDVIVARRNYRRALLHRWRACLS